jgi:uncharacterized protein (TIGR03083 family)
VQLTPRYDGPPVLRLEVPMGDPAVPLLRQRRRLAERLEQLDEDQWTAPTRCDGWSVQDVVAHLVGTNQYWAISIAAGLSGTPTRYLATFDPVATPAQMVDPMRALAPAEVLAQYTQSVDSLADAVTGLDEQAWAKLGEAPPGHIELRAVALHALWDAWIHERDIVLPLGLDPVCEEDEIVACLAYAAGVGPAFRATGGATRAGTLTFVASDPDCSFVVESGATVVVRAGAPAEGAPVVRGAAVDLVEGLSFRAALDHGLAEDERWLLGGLDDVFDVAGAASG